MKGWLSISGTWTKENTTADNEDVDAIEQGSTASTSARSRSNSASEVEYPTFETESNGSDKEEFSLAQ